MTVSLCFILRWPLSVITPAVVEAVFVSLLTQAKKADKEAQNPTKAECMVLNEFGHCLMQIVKNMFKINTHGHFGDHSRLNYNYL